MITTRASLLLLAVLAACGRDRAKPDSAALTATATSSANANPSADSAKQFVQAFYDWYVPLANGPATVDAYDSVLTTRGDAFSSGLLAALRDDIGWQRRDSVAEIVSVSAEYDVFLNSQDPCSRYEAREARATTSGYAVGVYGTCASAPATTAAIVVDVERGNRGWAFANFKDPERPQDDLLSQLQRAKADRAK